MPWHRFAHRLQDLHRAWSRLPVALALAVAVLPPLVVLWGALWLDMDQRDQQLETSYENRIHNVAQVSAQALYGMFIAADQTLLDLREAWVRDPGQFGETVQRRRRAASLGVDFDISVIDPEGVVTFSSLTPRAQGMQVGNMLHFSQPRDALDDTLVIGAPTWARMSGRWLMPLSRRLPPAADGTFTGVIVFWVSPDFFSRIYRSTYLHPGSVFTLIDLDSGNILLRHHKPGRHTDPQEATGRFASDAALVQLHSQPTRIPDAALQTARQMPRTGTGHWASTVDAEVRNYAWHRFNQWNLLLMAGEPRHYYTDEAAQDSWRYLSAGVLLSALIVITALAQLAYLRSRERHVQAQAEQLQLLEEQRTELQRQREQLRELGQHLEQIRETERQRIAQDLHDDIGQQLSVLRLGAAQLHTRLLRAADTGTGAATLPVHADEAGQLKLQIDHAIATVRRISEDLRPTALSLGLSAAVQGFCETLQHHTGLVCHLDDRLDPHHQPCPMCATTAYRILQEAASNTLRHAKAQSLEVGLRIEDGHLVLDLHDDGIGIEPTREADPQRQRFGLLGMHERVRAQGGQLTLHSEPGQGTTLQVRLPLCQGTPQDHSARAATPPDQP
ncbi:MAG: ATP-binding protein [Hydrogenophaga sp.]